MSMQDDESKIQELVIIRRGNNGEEGGHHGGVWKIAYADFMTAMMAFFLVMWLINSTDKKTLTQIATYFNPLRLTDKTASSRGVHQMDATTTGQETQPGNTPQKIDRPSATVEGKAKFTEEALFQDPMGALDKIAKDAAERPAGAAAQQGGPETRAHAAEGARDPFDPAFRREIEAEQREAGRRAAALPPAQAVEAPPAPKQAATVAGEKVGPAERTDAPLAESGAVESQGQTQGQTQDQTQGQTQFQPKSADTAGDQQKAEPAAQQTPEAAEHLKAEAPARQKAETLAQKKAQAQAAREAAARIEAEIKTSVAGAALSGIPNIEVKATDEGILISLTDDYDFGMFAIASAEPRAAMVAVMEKLARVLAHQTEQLVVRGHTDGRPYKNGGYDNWRLSTARAHMAYYMLVRGGITDKRFERVEGYADHSLRVPHDPEAAQNRRIEILLRKAKP